MSRKNRKKKLSNASPEKTNIEKTNNSLTDLTSGLCRPNQLNSLETVENNQRYGLISMNRQLLSELYVEHGIIQTLIDQPVDDGFSRGYEVKTSLISEDELAELNDHIKKIGAEEAITDVCKWKRLFGGGSVVVIDDLPLDKPLNMKVFRPKSNIEYYAADNWELYKPFYTLEIDDLTNNANVKERDYMFYGRSVDPSRVMEVHGKKAPSITRRRLRGWGMSEVERLIRSLNAYIKNNNVIFELLDEAKVDVYKINEFNNALLTAGGTGKVQERLQLGNQIKNYLNALVMDVNDEYEQKNMSFSGLAEMLTQARMGIASDMKMPITKIFGVSASGFNSGEDDIENYNSMVESSVRKPAEPVIREIYRLECWRLYGVDLTDMEIEWPSLRVLNSTQQEEVKDKQFNRTISAYNNGLIDTEMTKEAINKGSLLPIQLEVSDEVFEGLGAVEETQF